MASLSGPRGATTPRGSFVEGRLEQTTVDVSNWILRKVAAPWRWRRLERNGLGKQ